MLQKIIWEKRPCFLFLIETRYSLSHIVEVKDFLGYDGCVNVDSMGHSGGLVLLWKDVISTSLLSSSLSHIDIAVDFPVLGRWRLT